MDPTGRGERVSPRADVLLFNHEKSAKTFGHGEIADLGHFTNVLQLLIDVGERTALDRIGSLNYDGLFGHCSRDTCVHVGQFSRVHSRALHKTTMDTANHGFRKIVRVIDYLLGKFVCLFVCMS